MSSKDRRERQRDHPRACGENGLYVFVLSSARGSPPRMRGKRQHSLRLPQRSGITPAHAGKTGLSLPGPHRSWDHPRACGENDSTLCAFLSVAGSPPRMRGKHYLSPGDDISVGITPAHAGKTPQRVPRAGVDWDHPRACGENTSERAYFRG